MPALPTGYPLPRPATDRPWQQGKSASGPLSTKDPANIAKLLAALKAYVAPAFNRYLADPTNAATRPDAFGWRKMPWLGDADCDVDWSGSDATAGTSTGQLIPAGTLPGQRTDAGGTLQNHSITWYDPWASFALSAVFGAPAPGAGDPTKEQMVDGSVLVKIAVLTPYPDGTDWPTVTGAPLWPVYRPPAASPAETDYCSSKASFQLLKTHVLQFDVILKSSYYAPKTEWVFATWLYDPNAKGSEPLDHFTALGAMWGNDPEIPQKDFCTPTKPLQENWINPGTPAYGYQQLGWGCRLSGPIDIARRPVEFTNGSQCATARVSACMSCHGSSEFAKTSTAAATLYPLTKGYNPFVVADPGSKDWWNWFQSRSPTAPQGDQSGQNPENYIAFDYDMVFVSSVPISRAAAGDKTLEAEAKRVNDDLRLERRVMPLTKLTAPPGAAAAPAPPPGCNCSCAPGGKH